MRTAKIVAASVLMTAALYGCSQPSEAQAPPAPSVTVAVPLVQAVQDWDEFTGRFEATQSVEVRARVGGYVSGVHFRDGDYVRRGQLLFSLDSRPAQAALASARAQLSQAQAQLALAQSELTRSETLLESQAVSRPRSTPGAAPCRRPRPPSPPPTPMSAPASWTLSSPGSLLRFRAGSRTVASTPAIWSPADRQRRMS